MLNFIAELFTILNAASPYAVIALLGVIIYVLVYQGGGMDKLRKGQDSLANNHFQDLKECMDRMVVELRGIGTNIDQTRHEIVRTQSEVQQTLAWIQARVNGKSSGM